MKAKHLTLLVLLSFPGGAQAVITGLRNPSGGGGGTPAGVQGDVQIKNNGIFGVAPFVNIDTTTNVLSITGTGGNIGSYYQGIALTGYSAAVMKFGNTFGPQVGSERWHIFVNDYSNFATGQAYYGGFADASNNLIAQFGLDSTSIGVPFMSITGFHNNGFSNFQSSFTYASNTAPDTMVTYFASATTVGITITMPAVDANGGIGFGVGIRQDRLIRICKVDSTTNTITMADGTNAIRPAVQPLQYQNECQDLQGIFVLSAPYATNKSYWLPVGRGIAKTGVTAGSYTNSNVTVDAFGRITTISNGSAGGGGSSSIAVSSNNVIVSSPTTNINFMPPFIVTLQGSTSAQVTLNSSSVTLQGVLNDIHNQNSLQAGATAYPDFEYVGTSITAPIGFFSTSVKTPYLNVENAGNALIDLYKNDGAGTSTGRITMYEQLAGKQERGSIRFNDSSTNSIGFYRGTTLALLIDNTNTRLESVLSARLDAGAVWPTLSPGVMHVVAGSSTTVTGLVSMSSETTGAFISSVNVSAAFSVTANGLNNTAITLSANSSSTTLQGNTFNAANKLAQLDGSALLPLAQLPGHKTTHQSGGADEISVTGLLGLLSAAQKVAVTTGTTDIAVSTRIAFVAGSNMTITPVVGASSVTLTFSASGSGGGGGYAVEPATVAFKLDQGMTASSGTFSGQVLVNSTFSVTSSTIIINGSTTYWNIPRPGGNRLLQLDSSGNITLITASGTGDAVLAATQTWSGGNTFNSWTTFNGSVTFNNGGALTLTNMTFSVNIATGITIIDNGNNFVVQPSTSLTNTADMTTASATLGNATYYAFPVAANETWGFDFYFLMTGVSGGTEFGFNGPVGSTVTAVVFGDTSAVGTFSTASILSLNTADTVAFNTTAAAILLQIHGTLAAGGTSGTCQLMWKSVTGGNTSTIKAGSHMLAKKVN